MKHDFLKANKFITNLFFVFFTKALAATTDSVPHYIIENLETASLPTLLAAIPTRPDLPEKIGNLLTDCEIRPNGVFGTAHQNQLYFLRIISQDTTQNYSHLAIKQLAPGCM